MKLIPDWVWAIAVVTLVLLIGAQQLRVEKLRTEVEAQKTVVAQRDATIARINGEGERAKADWANERANLQATHAADQQRITDEYQTKVRVAERRAAADRADNERLREQVRGFSSVPRAEGESDAALHLRTADRLKVVGGLLEEAVGLHQEGRQIIERRDREVGLLLGQIKADRVACEAARTTGTRTPETAASSTPFAH